MSAVACDIEVSERQRACNVAGAMLQPARIIGRRRYRAARASTCLSCLRDSILICAHRARLSSLVGDLSVVRRDVVHAGCVASKRAHCNFNILQRLLRRHHANILILSEKDGTVVQHMLGDSVGRCIGNIYIYIYIYIGTSALDTCQECQWFRILLTRIQILLGSPLS